MHWLFIGAGNMASSLIGGLLASGAATDEIVAVDSSPEALQRVQQQFAINGYTTLDSALSDTAVAAVNRGVVIAVKPAIVESVCRQLNDATTLLVSVAAGVTTSSLSQWLPDGTAIVRCMPNTPALLGLGATALFAGEHCTDGQRQAAEDLLATAGKTVWVDKEAKLDAVTALSGSGPAYFFYLIELMTESGIALGLDAQIAQELAIETAYGAASMARQGNHPPAVLRQNVTSKGGTTAAALATFDRLGLPEMVMQAMQAAHDRAVELGQSSADSGKSAAS